MELNMRTAKVFVSGNSQAVRIPMELHLDCDEVYIYKDEASGDLILSKRPSDWSGLLAVLDQADIPQDFLNERPNFPLTKKGIL